MAEIKGGPGGYGGKDKSAAGAKGVAKKTQGDGGGGGNQGGGGGGGQTKTKAQAHNEMLTKKLVGLIDPNNTMSGPIQTYLSPEGWTTALQDFFAAKPRHAAKAVEAWRAQIAALSPDEQTIARSGSGVNSLSNYLRATFPDLMTAYKDALGEIADPNEPDQIDTPPIDTAAVTDSFGGFDDNTLTAFSSALGDMLAARQQHQANAALAEGPVFSADELGGEG